MKTISSPNIQLEVLYVQQQGCLLRQRTVYYHFFSSLFCTHHFPYVMLNNWDKRAFLQHCMTRQHPCVLPRPHMPASTACVFFLAFSLISRSLLSYASSLLPLLNFSYWRMETSCALRKVPLKNCQLCFTPLFLRTVPQEISSSNSLNNWNFTLLEFRMLTLLFARPVFLEITNSTRS